MDASMQAQQDGYDNVYRANDGLDMRNTSILARDAPIDSKPTLLRPL